MNSTILLFEGGDELDAFGPFELVGNAANAGADVTTTLRTVDGSERATASHGLDVGAYLPNDAVWTVHGADSLAETSAVWLFVFEGENVHTGTAPARVASTHYRAKREHWWSARHECGRRCRRSHTASARSSLPPGPCWCSAVWRTGRRSDWPGSPDPGTLETTPLHRYSQTFYQETPFAFLRVPKSLRIPYSLRLCL